MPVFYIMIGAPGSGKSRYVSKNFTGKNVVSPDKERDTQGVDVAEAYRRTKLLLREFLAAGNDVVLDATNSRSAYRKEMIGLAKPHADKIVGVWVDTSLEECLRHHRERMETQKSERYPKDTEEYRQVTQGYLDALQQEPPTLDEGFDELIVIR